MSTIWSRAFWKATAERMVRGFAIAALTVIGGNVLDAFSADWLAVAGGGLGGAVISLLLSLAGNAVSGDGPSFNRAEKVNPEHAL